MLACSASPLVLGPRTPPNNTPAIRVTRVNNVLAAFQKLIVELYNDNEIINYDYLKCSTTLNVNVEI